MGQRRVVTHFLLCVLVGVIAVSFTFRVLPDLAEFAQTQKYVQVRVAAQARRAERVMRLSGLRILRLVGWMCGVCCRLWGARCIQQAL